MQNRTEKQTMPFKTTVNWLFNDIKCYFVIGCFNWKIGIFQQTVVRVYYILKLVEKTNQSFEENEFALLLTYSKLLTQFIIKFYWEKLEYHGIIIL